jgi:hypothetical protein
MIKLLYFSGFAQSPPLWGQGAMGGKEKASLQLFSLRDPPFIHHLHQSPPSTIPTRQHRPLPKWEWRVKARVVEGRKWRVQGIDYLFLIIQNLKINLLLKI